MRLCIVQPSLAQYRVPVYRALARRPGIDLTVWHAQGVGKQNVPADGFAAELRPMRRGHVRGHPIYWHPAQLQAARGFDAVIFNWDVHYASLVPALLRARWNGVGTVLWGHGVSGNDGGLAGQPKRWLARLADALLLYNAAAADHYRTRGFANVFAAPNTIDVEPVDRVMWRDHEQIAGFRRQHHLKGPTLLHVSRLARERRVDLLLQATAGLDGAHVVIVGGGPAEAELRAQAESLGVDARFVGPLYDPSQLAPWYAAASAVVMPSYGGLGILSAMAYGVPVVIGDDPHAHGPEAAAVEDGVNGRHFTHGDARALHAVLSEVLAEDGKRDDMAAAAYRTVRQHFGLNAMVDGMVAAAESAASARNK